MQLHSGEQLSDTNHLCTTASAGVRVPERVVLLCCEQWCQRLEGLPGLLPGCLKLSLEQQRGRAVRLTGQQPTHLHSKHTVGSGLT